MPFWAILTLWQKAQKEAPKVVQNDHFWVILGHFRPKWPKMTYFQGKLPGNRQFQAKLPWFQGKLACFKPNWLVSRQIGLFQGKLPCFKANCLGSQGFLGVCGLSSQIGLKQPKWLKATKPDLRRNLVSFEAPKVVSGIGPLLGHSI